MSDFSRTSSVSVNYGGDGTPTKLDPYLLDFTYVDHLHGQADTLSLRLQDRDQWSADARPAKGDSISATIDLTDWWDDGDSLYLDTGTMIVDEVAYSASPAIVEIRAQSVTPETGAAREKRSTAWEATTLRTIASDIADAAGWSLQFDLLSIPQYDRVDQAQETDLSFLRRLAQDAGGIVKVWDGILVVSSDAALELALPAKSLILGTNRILGWRWKDQTATIYGSCRVSYWDTWQDKLITHTATSATQTGPVLEIKARVTNIAAAITLAEGSLATANKTNDNDSASMSLVGDPDLLAGRTVDVVTGTGLDGRYLVTSATHRRGAGGYTTDIGLRLVAHTGVSLPSLDEL